MKRKRKDDPRGRPGRLDAAQIWADIEDHFVPNLQVGLAERVVYFHLVRKMRLAGKRRAMTSLGQLANEVCLTKDPVRSSLRSLARKGALRILECGYDGHRIELRLPREIPSCLKKEPRTDESILAREDCFRSGIARLAIFEREKHRCFYCLGQLEPKIRVLDHVRPRARGGDSSYRNVVACCEACNSLKRNSDVEDFLRILRRQKIISRTDFHNRLATLKELKLGRLKPKWPRAA
jgi:hypothetical protein